jgi:glucosamine 6-phosphate synthetase-like amidotransferase/phosphosugar isomerase protein
MCGIAGYSVDSGSTVQRTLAAQALLAGIAERGADAVGYAFRGPLPTLTVHKQRTGASALLETISLPGTASQALLHVRDYTKGLPTIAANNHPIRHGSVVGIHNGIVLNDDELLARYGLDRHEHGMTVDSEAIFALMQATASDHRTLEQIRGAMAAAWIDERDPQALHLARGLARPLWLGHGRHELFFASTRAALEVVESTLRLSLRKTEVREGRAVRVEGAVVVAERRFRPDRRYREENALPAVRAPHERASCLARLAILAGAR